jgi:hypothetical protein
MFEGDDFVSCDPWLIILAPFKKTRHGEEGEMVKLF